MKHLDSDLLRTFLAVADSGSMTIGAARIHRTQSATSLQIKRLEDVLQNPVFFRHGRGVTLTPLGTRLLPTARQVVASLDTALRSLTADTLAGTLRLGIPDDHSQDTLAQIIAEFTQSHPSVELAVTCDLSAGFSKALKDGELDLAVYEVAEPEHPEDVLWRDRTQWVTSCNHDLLGRDILPVALFDRACWWRDAALDALNTLNRPYRVVYSSQSVQGVAAAVEAGVAVALLGSSALSATIRKLDVADGFPDMPCSHLILGSAGAETPARQSMETAIRSTFAKRYAQH